MKAPRFVTGEVRSVQQPVRTQRLVGLFNFADLQPPGAAADVYPGVGQFSQAPAQSDIDMRANDRQPRESPRNLVDVVVNVQLQDVSMGGALRNNLQKGVVRVAIRLAIADQFANPEKAKLPEAC